MINTEEYLFIQEKEIGGPASPSPSLLVPIHYFCKRTTKSGRGGTKPAVTAYSELPNSAIVVGTFVAGFEANGSVIWRTIAPDKKSGDSSTTATRLLAFCATYSVFPSSSRPSALSTSPPVRSLGRAV